VVPHHLVEVLQNTAVATAFAIVVASLNAETSLNITVTAPWANTLNVFNFFLGMFISFRLNGAFTNWANGVGRISALENTSGQLMNCMYASLLTDAPQEDRQQRLDFLWSFKNTLILYIANVFESCSGDNGRNDNLRITYLSPVQIETKDSINALVKKSRDTDLSVLESCMPPTMYIRTLELELRNMIGTAAGNFALNPLVAGGLGGKVDTLSQLNNAIYGMANVPVVFIYNQFINFVILTYLSLYTLITIPDAGYWTSFWVFIWGFIVFLANSIADEIGRPFGNDNNDIELEIILSNIKDEYMAMYNYVSQRH
jgi:predicted membrane chloride channel (bestrophin family)